MSDAAESPTRLAWLDVETTGLDPVDDGLLEIGWRITDLDLNVLHEASWVMWDEHNKYAVAHLMGEYVSEMHTKNGLLSLAQSEGIPRMTVDLEMYKWLTEEVNILRDGKLPISGSSLSLDVAFLRYQFPRTYDLFHYRIIDNSTMKEMCRRYNPELFAKMPEHPDPEHRVFSCLDVTLSEAKFYIDNFIFDARKDDNV